MSDVNQTAREEKKETKNRRDYGICRGERAKLNGNQKSESALFAMVSIFYAERENKRVVSQSFCHSVYESSVR
jgi:hypothetical protein